MSATPEHGGVTLSSGALAATFLPDLGMLGVSLRHRGDELLALPGGLEGYRAGKVTGLPLLAPWANRLGAWRYAVDGVVVNLAGLGLTTDEHGQPIHGTMTAQPGWEVVAADERSLTARFDVGAHPQLLAAFPFPHELRIEAVVDPTALSVATTLTPTTDRAVPVAFGFHPYLRLPGVPRAEARLRLPDRTHLAVDDRGLPTGGTRHERAEDEPLAARAFDDLYALGEDRRLSVAGGGRRLTLVVGEGYRYAQVFTPPTADAVCLEPMTAPVNALVDGGCALVGPGASFTARFALVVDDA